MDKSYFINFIISVIGSVIAAIIIKRTKNLQIKRYYYFLSGLTFFFFLITVTSMVMILAKIQKLSPLTIIFDIAFISAGIVSGIFAFKQFLKYRLGRDWNESCNLLKLIFPKV